MNETACATCTLCNRTLPVGKFYIDRKRNKPRSHCIECERAQWEAYYARNKTKINKRKAERLKHRYHTEPETRRRQIGYAVAWAKANPERYRAAQRRYKAKLKAKSNDSTAI